MKFTRKATAIWEGPGKEGSGTLSTESEVLQDTPYSFHTRFENGKGTNPEELIGAAHAGCFTMQLSFLLGKEGFTPNKLQTMADVKFEDGAVTEITLNLTGDIEGIEESKFQEIAEEAKEICPISKLLSTTIRLNTTLR